MQSCWRSDIVDHVGLCAGYCDTMSDLNTAFINGLIKDLGSDVDGDDKFTPVKATVDCSVHKQDITMTTHSVSEPCLSRENNVRECVWESCCIVPVKSANLNASKRKLQHNEEMESQSGHVVNSLKHLMRKNDGKGKNKRRAKSNRKKSKHCSTEKVNLDHGNDLCLLVEKAALQAHDANVHSLVSRDTDPTMEHVENVADSMTELSTGFEHNSYVKEVRNDAVVIVNPLQAAPLSTYVSQEDLVGMPDKNILNVASDENKNMLNNDFLHDKECQEKVELLKSDTTVDNFQACCDLALNNSGNTIQCRMNNCIDPPLTAYVPCNSEDVSTCQHQKKVILNKDKRRRFQGLKTGKSTILKLQSEKAIYNEPGDLSAVDKQKEYAETTTVQLKEQDADIAGREDQCSGFVKATPDISTTQCLSRISADMQISNQCILEDDFDDIAAFPTFTKRSSRRLRRTSIEIYRSSLRDEENIADEESDTVSVLGNTENDTASADVDMHSAGDDALCNEIGLLTTESDHCPILPTSDVSTVDVQSDVQTVELPVSSNSNSTSGVKPKIDSSLMNITNNRPQRRRSANSQVSLGVPVALPVKARLRKPSVSVEDIYLNRLWRSQMPKEKALESIPESPMNKQHSSKVTKRVRCLKFDDVPNRSRLRQRRQKAVKNGWKPLTKKQNALLDSQLASKLAEIDSDLSVIINVADYTQ